MKNLTFEKEDGIGVIRLNRPEALNALNRQTVDELDTLIERIKEDPEVRVLIFGSGDNFAAGGDIKEMINCNVEEARAFSFNKTFQKIYRLSIPTIAAINGYALGGGLELALACDFRVAAPNAKMGLPEINLGIMPGAGGTTRVPRLIGMAKAKELIFLGEIIDAFRAEQIGLVDKVTAQGDSMATAMEWAKKLSAKAPVALRTAKESIQDGASEPLLEDSLKLEEEHWANLFSTEDQKEGMKAFLEKRRPNYQGK
jgi:enoyl-CoA hydratase/carnithine racemase